MRYNIFTALKIERKELIHSSMIIAIASYNKSCRKLFFEMLKKRSDQNNLNNLTELEKAIDEESYINWINAEHKLVEVVNGHVRDRGRADIWVGNKAKPSYRLIIDNKIDAGNQDHQLRKYYRYLTGNDRENAGLFYLCLKNTSERENGAEVSAEGFKSESRDVGPTKKILITYQEDILPWLYKIKELIDIESDFRVAIQQYIDLIIKLIK